MFITSLVLVSPHVVGDPKVELLPVKMGVLKSTASAARPTGYEGRRGGEEKG